MEEVHAEMAGGPPPSRSLLQQFEMSKDIEGRNKTAVIIKQLKEMQSQQDPNSEKYRMMG